MQGPVERFRRAGCISRRRLGYFHPIGTQPATLVKNSSPLPLIPAAEKEEKGKGEKVSGRFLLGNNSYRKRPDAFFLIKSRAGSVPTADAALPPPGSAFPVRCR